MHSLSLRDYQQLLARLNQMSIRGNRHKMAIYLQLNPDPLGAQVKLSEANPATTLLAFHLMFERNNADSPWRLVTPVRFTD